MEFSRDHLVQLDLDLKDLEGLLGQATRDHSRSLLNKEIETIRKRIEQATLVLNASEPKKIEEAKGQDVVKSQ